MSIRPRLHLLLPVALALLALAPQASPAHGQPAASLSFIVTSTVDAPDAHPGDGLCADSSGRCTLRAAVQEADAQPVGSSITILVPAWHYVLALGTLNLTGNTITLAGAGASTTLIDGQGSRVVAVGPGARVVFAQITLAGGRAPIGGGIANAGAVFLVGSRVMSNTATEGGGGGIANGPGAQLQVVDSALVSNTATISPSAPAGCPGSVLRATTGNGGAGGALANCGVAQVVASTVSHNTAVVGGGIANAGTLTVSGSSLSENTAQVGGAIASTGTLTLTSSSVTSNTATLPCCFNQDGGGGLYSSGMASVISSTLSGNSTLINGGGIDNGGPLSVIDSTLSGNTAINSGGGIANGSIVNGGTVSVTDSTISGNTAQFGGGIANVNGPLSVTDSTISGNTAPASAGAGGGIDNLSGPLSVTDSTISGNTANDGGGGFFNTVGGTVSVSDSTISGNAGSTGGGGGGGGIDNNGGTLTLSDTIVASNTALPGNGPDCAGALTSGGYNLVGIGHGCSGLINGINGDQVGSSAHPLNPHLSPLQNNGGPTQTMALLPGSPAIDNGGTVATGCPATDQRGLPRPDEAADNGACDIGAFESESVG